MSSFGRYYAGAGAGNPSGTAVAIGACDGMARWDANADVSSHRQLAAAEAGWNTLPGTTKYAPLIAQYVFVLAGNDLTISHDLEPGRTYEWTVVAPNAFGWGTEPEAWTVIAAITATSLSEGAQSDGTST